MGEISLGRKNVCEYPDRQMLHEVGSWLMEWKNLKAFRDGLLSQDCFREYLPAIRQWCVAVMTGQARRAVEEALRYLPVEDQSQLVGQMAELIYRHAEARLVHCADHNHPDYPALAGASNTAVKACRAMLHPPLWV
ncbi:hypothetical protein HY933_00010 [Candidatus Falkowbacteria bacterium]|nr:hypothetical protein [Candidatus Falkowbacteria bacterium]